MRLVEMGAGLLLAIRPCLAAEPATKPPVVVTASDRVIFHVPTRNDTLKVIVTERIQEPPGIFTKTVSRLRIENGTGHVQFSDSTEVLRLEDGALAESYEVSVDTTRIGGELVIELVRWVEPSYPTPFVDTLRLAVRNGVAVQVTSWCLMYGAGAGSSLYADAIGHTGESVEFSVPMRPRFDRPGGGFEPVAQRDPAARDLAIIEPDAILYADSLRVRPRPIRLFREPVGETADSVLVSPTSSISFGRVWARVVDGCYCCVGEDDPPEPELHRLEVTVDGRHGFVEPRDFDALGMFWVG